MSKRAGSNPSYFHDGASQAARRPAALDPDHFLIDERSIADLLAFAKKFAAQLTYYNTDNAAQGNWSAFLAGNPAEMAAFLENPAAFDAFPEKKEQYSRPHLALFLTFLKLLQSVQAEINTLTRRQLDFYYQEALGFVKKAAVPDHVHVLAQLRPNQPELLIPKDTLLAAGKDDQGRPIQYRTEEDLIVNRTRIARLMNLRVEKKLTDVRMLRFIGDKEGLEDRGFLSILQLIYRKPGSAGTLRDFPIQDSAVLPFDQSDIIGSLDGFRDIFNSKLKTPIGQFIRILNDYHEWHAENRWQAGSELMINDLLQKFYRKNRGSAARFVINDPRNFDANFKTALGFTVAGAKDDGTNVFDGLRGVDNIYDLYDRYMREKAQPDKDLIEFITEQFGNVAYFLRFMQLRTAGLAALKRVIIRLWEVGVRNPDIGEPGNASYLHYEKDNTLAYAFTAILRLDPDPRRNDAYLFAVERRLQAMETYFGMSAEDYFFMRDLYQYEYGVEEIPDWKWERADQLLEQAYARYYGSLSGSEKEAMPPKPQLQRWRNIYGSTDTTQISLAPTTQLQPADIGWALYSPALALSEGRRSLSLMLVFSATEFNAQRLKLQQYLKNWQQGDNEKGPYPFRLEISTEKGWLAFPDWIAFNISAITPVINIMVSASEDVPPFVPLADDTYRHTCPGLRLILVKDELVYTDEDTDREYPISVYDLFKGMSLKRVGMAISVTGLQNLVIQTPSGLVKTGKPFAPFGAGPAVGDRFFITHPEIARQQLDSVALQLEWKNLPPGGLTAYYQPYKDLTSGGKLEGIDAITSEDISFTIDLSMIEGRRRMELPLEDAQLFSADGSAKSLISDNIPSVFLPNNVPYTPMPRATLGREVTDSDRYLEVELTPRDFLHGRYRRLLDKQAETINIKALGPNANTQPVKDAIIALTVSLPEPFSPVLQGISLSYTTRVEINWMQQIAGEDTLSVHLEPFGEVPLPVAGRAVPFLPNLEAEGTLYIGLEGLQPPRDVSFLFQMAEGSANPELLPTPLEWSYLSRNRWIPFSDRDLLRETTQGLLSSGLVKLHFPADATNDDLRMPGGLHWLRIQVAEQPDSHSNCIAIHTQALAATWEDNGGAGLHLSQALPPGSIQKTVDPLPGLAGLWQPYASFHGITSEVEAGWYTRISERLRHKSRALTMWDYERLVLEHFPDIYRAKALAADLLPEDAPPGTVRIVVIPDIRNRPVFYPFEPRVAIARIQQIQAFLQSLAPPYARVQVQNPRFLHLRMRLAVRFYDMNNFGYYTEQLDHAIQAFMSPWAFDHTGEVAFGGKIYPSVLVDFIENLPYVDYLEEPEFRLMQKEADGVLRVLAHQPRDADGLLHVTAPDTLLVSAGRHIIEYLPAPGEDPGRIRRGIGYTKIEYDFQVRELY